MEKNDIFKYQVKRNIVSLYKSFLIQLEDVKKEHDKSIEKLKKSLPNEAYMVDLADYLDEEDLQEMRKKILDNGNDCIRNIDETAKNCGMYN